MNKEVVEKLAALITAGFGLIAALAWNDTIKAIFARAFGETGTIWAMFAYAVVVTMIAVFASIQIGKMAAKAK